MNWTASLLRNQLRKQQADYKSRLTLLTRTNSQAENYLQLEEKVKVLEANLQATEQNLANLKTEAELKEKDKGKELKELELKVKLTEKQRKESKELITNLREEIRLNQLYYQRELRKVKEDYQEKLTKEKQRLETNYQTKFQQLGQNLSQAKKELLEKTFLLSLRERKLINLKTDLAKLTTENTQLVADFYQQKQAELSEKLQTRKGSTARQRKDLVLLEAISQKLKEIESFTYG